MADSDKLGLGLDDIIRKDRTGNRRGGGGNRGFRGRIGRGGGNGFRNRGGGGVVNLLALYSGGAYAFHLASYTVCASGRPLET